MTAIKEECLKELIWGSFRAMNKCRLNFNDESTKKLMSMCSLALTFNSQRMTMLLESFNEIAIATKEYEVSEQIIDEIKIINEMTKMVKLFK